MIININPDQPIIGATYQNRITRTRFSVLDIVRHEPGTKGVLPSFRFEEHVRCIELGSETCRGFAYNIGFPISLFRKHFIRLGIYK